MSKEERRYIEPIAHIYTDFAEKFGVPRQSGRVPELRARVIFEPEYRDAAALREIEGFSYVWLIFDFSLAHREGWSPTVRPPRLGGERRVGVFASRSPFRPNSLGLSSVRLESVEYGKDGPVLSVAGADMVNGTPIYDIKPYIPYADAHADAKPGFTADYLNYRLEVDFPPELLEKVPEDKRAALIACIADDPRPSYQDEPDRVYGMCFAGLNISFRVEGEKVMVCAVELMENIDN